MHADRRSPERSAPRLYALIPSTALILIFVFHLRPDPPLLPPFPLPLHPRPASADTATILQPFLTPFNRLLSSILNPFDSDGYHLPSRVRGRHTYFPELRAFKSFRRSYPRHGRGRSFPISRRKRHKVAIGVLSREPVSRETSLGVGGLSLRTLSAMRTFGCN